MKNIFLFFIAFMISDFMNAQSTISELSLSEKDLSGINILQSKIYDGNSLWGLIDGGADIYLEYGFDKLYFYEIVFNTISLRIEIYKMVSPQAAFGIFSVSKHKCELNDSLYQQSGDFENYLCFNRFQFQSAYGQYYFNIINEAGNREAQNLSLNIFEILKQKIKYVPFKLPIYFERELFHINIDNLKFISGKLGFQNGFPAWSDLFYDFSGYEIFILPLKDDEEIFSFSLIKFNAPEELQLLKQKINLLPDKNKFRLYQLSDFEMILIESNLSEESLKKSLVE